MPIGLIPDEVLVTLYVVYVFVDINLIVIIKKTTYFGILFLIFTCHIYLLNCGLLKLFNTKVITCEGKSTFTKSYIPS